MNLRNLINRLEELSHNGERDHLRVVFKLGKDWELYPEVMSAWVNQEPDYNFDEANCDPDEWVELAIPPEEEKEFLSEQAESAKLNWVDIDKIRRISDDLEWSIDSEGLTTPIEFDAEVAKRFNETRE